MPFRIHSGLTSFIAHTVLVVGFFTGRTADAQTQIPEPDGTRTSQIIPGAEYEAGGLHRMIFGDLWRDLWTTQVNVPVLDLRSYAGGLAPLRRGGGFQTQSLRFMGADGIQYKFRSLNKNPEKVLDPELRHSIVADVLQDLISTANPVSALVVAPILNAVNVLNAQPVLVQLPDSEELGEFREEFGGLVGMLEIHPDDGETQEESFAGADKVAGTYKMFEKIEGDNKDRVDGKAFLTARLMDIFLGDWDRHVDQWRWARFDSGEAQIWKPIPRDRDQAFCRYDGLVPRLAARAVPQIEGCEEDYPDINDLTWSGRHLDRKFLVPVNRHDWDSITAFIRSRLTDSLFSYALNRLPPEMYEKEAQNLGDVLRKRREGFTEASRTFYRQIAKYPDIYASDDPEHALIERLDDQHVRVRLFRINKKTGTRRLPAFFDRTFNRDETRDIRLYMLGDDDTITVTGNVESSIQVRIIGGSGADHLIDSSHVEGDFLSFIPFIPNAENQTLFYDDGKKTTVIPGSGTSWDRSSYEEPENDTLRWEPPVRDYGHDWKAITWLGYNPDEGVFVGGGPALYEHGFRADPYVFRLSLAGGIATRNGTFKAEFKGDFYKWIPGAHVSLYALGSQFELMKFFGFGNESVRSTELLDKDYYEIEQTQTLARVMINFPFLKDGIAGLGAEGSYITTELAESAVLDTLRPYGINDPVLVNLTGRYTLDSRDNTSAPTSGLYVDLSGEWFPNIVDNEHTFGRGIFDARTYLTAGIPVSTTLALRAAGGKLWGTFPYFESIFLGGSRSLRGYEQNRFAGEAALWTSAELRTELFRYSVLVPGTVGLVGIADAGRVWYGGEESDRWHTAIGAGLTISFIESKNVLVLSAVHSREKQIAYYASFGFPF